MSGTPFKMKGHTLPGPNQRSSPAKQHTGAAILSPEQKKKLDSSGRPRKTALGDKITAAISSIFSAKGGPFANPEGKSYKELKKEARSKQPKFIGTKTKVKKITVDEFTR